MVVVFLVLVVVLFKNLLDCKASDFGCDFCRVHDDDDDDEGLSNVGVEGLRKRDRYLGIDLNYLSRESARDCR